MSDMFTQRHYPAAVGAGTLLVMLPGAGMEAADFAANGMIAAVHERGLPIDIIATRPPMGLYLDGDIAAALHDGVITAARAKNYAKIWLPGISLGGMGALLYAAAHAALLDGIILLAPFIGTQGTIAAIEESGGLAHFAATETTTPPEARLLRWLRRRPENPALYLGYGLADRFSRGHRLLAATLPESHVAVSQGAHDWETWLDLWQTLLDTKLFGA